MLYRYYNCYLSCQEWLKVGSGYIVVEHIYTLYINTLYIYTLYSFTWSVTDNINSNLKNSLFEYSLLLRKQ